MQLLVKTLTGDTITINDVENNNTIMQLKHMIYEKSQNIAERQRLIAFGIILDNRKTVSFYNIKDGCVLHLIITLSNDLIYEPNGSTQLTIKTLTGKIIVLDNINNDTTIGQLQIMIRDKEGIPVNQQNIYMRSKNTETPNGPMLLDESQTIEYYNIEHGCILYLSLQLRGGGGMVSFASMKNFTPSILSDDAPDYRTICPGMSIHGVCKNNDCKANNDRVICNMGYGEFDVKHIDDDCYCPVCYQYIKHIGVGFYLADTIIDGIDSTGKVVDQVRKFIEPQYEENDGKTLWRELKITVKPFTSNKTYRLADY
jgi:hypothetical protein